MAYHGPPDWQFLTRFCSREEEELGWPFSIGEMIVATDRHACAWVPYRCHVDPPYVMPSHQHFSGCELSLDFLSRGGLDKPRRFIRKLMEQSGSVRYEPMPWEQFQLDFDFVHFETTKFDPKLIKRLPRIKLVGLSTVSCLEGSAQALFIRWGHNGCGLVLPHEDVKSSQPSQ